MVTQRDPEFDFDPLSAEFFNDPTDIYRTLRDTAPIHFDGRLGMWVVARYEDVAAALRDWETFSSAKGVTLSQALSPDDFDSSQVMMTMDPPRHTRLRSLVSRAFTPRSVADIEPRVREIVRSYLQPLESVTEFDAVADFANEFPVNVICSMIGVPEEDGRRINEWVSALLHREPGVPTMTQEGVEAALASGMYVYDLAAQRSEKPTDDMISRLCEVTIETDEGERAKLDLREVAGFIMLLTAAGTETVTKLIGSAVVLLDHNPDVRAALVAEPELIQAAVDETMRWAPPAQYMCRTTTREAVLPSGTIPGDATVMLLLGSAMRDPRVFAEPDEFRLDRAQKVPPLGFGLGVHACLGTALARLEGRIALEEFLARWPEYRVRSSELVRVTQENTAGYSHVPVSV